MVKVSGRICLNVVAPIGIYNMRLVLRVLYVVSRLKGPTQSFLTRLQESDFLSVGIHSIN